VKSSRGTKRRRPTGLTEPEVHGLLRVAGESKRGRAKRDYGLLQLLLQTNLRVGELTSLKLSDVQIRDRSGEVRVREGKGLKCCQQHFGPYVLVKFMLRWQQDGSGKERWRLLAAT
jgi:integrase